MNLFQLHVLLYLILCVTFTPYPVIGQINTCSPNITGTAPVDGNCLFFKTCNNGVQVGDLSFCNPVDGQITIYDYIQRGCSSQVLSHLCYPGLDIKCLPPSSPHFRMLVPDPIYCERVQMCINGTLVRTSCPSGLLFDYVQGTCKNDPVRCYPGTIRGYSPPVPSIPTTTTTTTPAPTFSSTTQDPNSRCTPGRPSFIAHETDCKKFFRCDFDGIAIPMECGEGQLFDNLQKVCMNEQMALCYFTATPPIPIVTTISTTTEIITTTPPIWECPPIGSLNITHLRNCCFYYSCINGHLSLDRCWGSELFDRIDLICKPQRRAVCAAGSVPCRANVLNIDPYPVLFITLWSIMSTLLFLS